MLQAVMPHVLSLSALISCPLRAAEIAAVLVFIWGKKINKKMEPDKSSDWLLLKDTIQQLEKKSKSVKGESKMVLG